MDGDVIIAEAETDNGSTEMTEDAVLGDTEPINSESQTSNAVDQDMNMEDAGIEGDDVPLIKSDSKPDIKLEVKLEDLFADIESDDEFPSSTEQDIKGESSPEAQSSLVLVNSGNSSTPTDVFQQNWAFVQSVGS
jgi:DNA primase small subunit